MLRNLFIVGGLIIFLVFFFVTLTYYTSYPQAWFSIESLPHVSWFDIRSGKWGNHIKRTVDISTFSSKYIVKNFDKNDKGWIQKYGQDGIVINNQELKTLKTQGVNSRPYTWGKMFTTNISGTEFTIVPQIWAVENNGLRVIPYIINENNMNNQEFLEDNSRYLVFPVLNYKNKNACLLYTNINEEYCSWWRKNSIFINTIKQIWSLTNNIPILMQSYPIVPVGMSFYQNED